MNDTTNGSNQTHCLLSHDLVLSILAFCSVIAFCVNAAVLVSVFWIRRPLTPILKMSISLAAADILTSTTMVIPQYIPDTLPKLKLIFGDLTFSVGLIATVAHLLALSVNHYIGIMKPLHYNAIMTSRKVSFLIAILWLLPIAFILMIYSVTSKGKFWDHILGSQSNDLNKINYEHEVTTYAYDYDSITNEMRNFGHEITTYAYDNVSTTDETRHILIENTTKLVESNFTKCDETEHYLYMFSLRMSFCVLLIVPIILMAVFYIHILIVVRRQQKKWKDLSRSGSRKYRGKMTRLNDQKSTKNLQSEQRQLEGNVKAIYTTFLIMGSCFIGWMPAVMMYILFCRCDCYVSGKQIDNLMDKYECQIIIVRFFENLLIIVKMCINPIIYSMRMKEIREGRARMYKALMRLFCPSRQNGSNYNLASQRSPNHNSGVSVQVQITSLRANGIRNYHNNRMTHLIHEPISNTLL